MVKRAPSGALSVYFPLRAPPARGLYASSPMLACLGAQTSARSVSYAVLTCMQGQKGSRQAVQGSFGDLQLQH